METTISVSIIEELRFAMINMAEQKGSLSDPEVVAISQQLDEWLVLAQQVALH
ncbi:aspartyl-phosphate phosphatase Spo0E family protein [Alicyclobacillus dauci]|uniref:Aspartyl-phosphate phosphatase Spo0E family protein n=1 Tax=Alicyclobacillus dauci TaxID=1475485 RepID=A0ABY6Z5V1_9BACL|nr:aspartyl-phosphate phosphatase Spo0E family protein [Alicyclobacillus dauci]WAH38251.1 aspartyl-phosphate phosphatase Spo0E family protein [Alicyclobacillus dauci]